MDSLRPIKNTLLIWWCPMIAGAISSFKEKVRLILDVKDIVFSSYRTYRAIVICTLVECELIEEGSWQFAQRHSPGDEDVPLIVSQLVLYAPGDSLSNAIPGIFG